MKTHTQLSHLIRANLKSPVRPLPPMPNLQKQCPWFRERNYGVRLKNANPPLYGTRSG
jgi:hypothetical protein